MKWSHKYIVRALYICVHVVIYQQFRRLILLAIILDFKLSSLSYLITQTTFQTVISTDGVVSFAAFIYGDLTSDVFNDAVIGFDAGVDDNTRSANVLQSGSFYDEDIGRISIFRIDGMYVCTDVYCGYSFYSHNLPIC